MQDDLYGLEIPQKELQKLAHLPVNEEIIIITNPLKRWTKQILKKMKGSEGATVIFLGFSILFLTHIIFDISLKFFATWITIPSWILLIFSGILGAIIVQIALYLLWKQRSKIVKNNMTHSLKILLSDVERYNAVIKAIDINDQIEAAGNPEVTVKQRQKVIEALKLTRSDLVRALKTERILRENKKFIISNTDLFTNNLATLASMQVTEQATEHGQLLNEALQIALDVQLEMRRLQSQH
ncbi:MAG: hypothetical protein PUP92_33175 [Rhizonema sp. PD38]|nr:hypothetical protein [Rhizonema sp. PD38]